MNHALTSGPQGCPPLCPAPVGASREFLPLRVLLQAFFLNIPPCLDWITLTYSNWITYGPYVTALMFVWLIIMNILLKHLTNDYFVKPLCIFHIVSHASTYTYFWSEWSGVRGLFKGALFHLWLCVVNNWSHDYIANWLHSVSLHTSYILTSELHSSSSLNCETAVISKCFFLLLPSQVLLYVRVLYVLCILDVIVTVKV